MRSSRGPGEVIVYAIVDKVKVLIDALRPPPRRVRYPSVAALLAAIPAKFMPTGTVATGAQMSGLEDWARLYLANEKISAEMAVTEVSAYYVSGLAAGALTVNGRQAAVQVRAWFPEGRREALLPLNVGATATITGRIRSSPSYSSLGGLSVHVGWDQTHATFYLAIDGCWLVGFSPAPPARGTSDTG